MNICYSKKILFVLCLCLTTIKDEAKLPKTKITDTNKQSGFLSFVTKPWQAEKIKKIDMEGIQKHTMEYVHKRLIVFIQNLDQKIFQNDKFKRSKMLERVADKKTTFSLQWQDIKSHYLIPIAKKHIHCYTEETIAQLKKIKKTFFSVLQPYAEKLQTLYNSRSLKVVDKYDVKPDPAFNEEQVFLAQKLALHREMASLLLDLPQRLMYWTPVETITLEAFAQTLGPLRETGGTQIIQGQTNDGDEEEDDGWGDDGGTADLGGEDFAAEEEEASDHEKPKSDSEKSSDSSSSSSSSNSDIDYNTDYFNNLPSDYFISDDESAPVHDEKSHYFPPVLPYDNTVHGGNTADGGIAAHNGISANSAHTTHNDDTVHNKETEHEDDSENDHDQIHDDLKAIEGNTNWEKERAFALERQLSPQPENDLTLNEQLNALRNELLESVLRLGGESDFKEIAGNRFPHLLDKIEKLKELESKKAQHKPKTQPSSPNREFPFRSRPENNGENSGNSVLRPPLPPSPPAPPTAHPSSKDPGSHSSQSVHHSEGPSFSPSGSTNPRQGPGEYEEVTPPSSSHDVASAESGRTLAGRTVVMEIKASVGVQQEKRG